MATITRKTAFKARCLLYWVNSRLVFLSARNGAKPHEIKGKCVRKIFLKTFVDRTYVRCYNKLPSKNEA